MLRESIESITAWRLHCSVPLAKLHGELARQVPYDLVHLLVDPFPGRVV